MYWKSKRTEINGESYYVYEFFQLIEKNVLSTYFYNPDTKQLQYPAKYELVVRERYATTEDEFKEWYATHRGF